MDCPETLAVSQAKRARAARNRKRRVDAAFLVRLYEVNRALNSTALRG